jgi:acetate kinase
VILAHLGNGASLAAARSGKEHRYQHGLHACAGLVMSTRTGDSGSGVVYYLARTERMSSRNFSGWSITNRAARSFRDQFRPAGSCSAQEAGDERAAEAVALFC